MPIIGAWSQEREDMARALFVKGLSAGQAAGVLGGITRNAVIGKWHRMGLRRGYARPRNIEKSRSKGPQAKAKVRPARKRVVLPPMPVEELPPPAVTDIARVSLMDLERHHCRWPVGEPTQGFCGCKPYPGLPYCEPHARRAFTPVALKPKGPSFDVNIKKRWSERSLVDA